MSLGNGHITDEQRDAVQRVVDVFCDPMVGMHVGPALTCDEVEAVAELLRAFDKTDEADWLLEHHSNEDEAGERHYRRDGVEEE